MNYIIIARNARGQECQAGYYFSELETARTVARIATVENPGTTYTVLPESEAL